MKQIEKRVLLSRNKRKTCFKVTLVGYTNAGKSTLFNVLSKADAPVENKLFKTLDSMTRMVKYKDTPSFLLTDTVGFIRDLPHELVASFKSTLFDVRDADLLLVVIDSTNPSWPEQLAIVEGVLKDIDAIGKEIILVFNKIDLIEDSTFMNVLVSKYPNSQLASAVKGTGIEELKDSVKNTILKRRITVTMKFNHENGRLLNPVYRYGDIHETQADGNSVILTFTIPAEIARKFGIITNT